MAGQRMRCKRCGARFTRPMGSRRINCETCRPPVGKPTAVAELPVEREPGPIEAAALLELGEAAATLAGASVLDMARALDAGSHTGSQRATLHDRMLRAAAEAKASGPKPASRLDELRLRREAKASGA